MKICVISGSSRQDSQGRRVSSALCELVKEHGHEAVVVDLFENNVTSVLNDVWANADGQGDNVNKISETVSSSDGFIVLSPEYAGMASAAIKAMFTVVSGFEHKPAMIVTVSASKGGSYPVAELRMSSYKNSKILYIPDHLIVRNVETAFTGDGTEYDTYITKRAKFTINILLKYAEALKTINEDSDMYNEEYAFGM